MSAPFAAIVLAGGFSTRMNSFKPLLPLGESTVTGHVIDTFLSAGVEVFLVVGHRRDEIKASIKGRDITIVDNPAYRQGMFSSIRAGIRRLRPAHQAFFVLPVDIPLVRPATIRRLMETAALEPSITSSTRSSPGVGGTRRWCRPAWRRQILGLGERRRPQGRPGGPRKAGAGGAGRR